MPQCKGRTQQDTQCGRILKAGNTYCYQHKDQEGEEPEIIAVKPVKSPIRVDDREPTVVRAKSPLRLQRKPFMTFSNRRNEPIVLE